MIWIITELFPPEETSTAFILGEIANTMATKYEVNVICGPEIYDKRKKKDSCDKFVLNPKISVTHVKGVSFDKNTFLGRIVRFVVISKQLYKLSKQRIKEGDKVLLVTNPAPIVVLISKLKLKNKFALNILVHDVFPENTRAAGIRIPKFLYKILKDIFDKAYSRADQLIALGRDMRHVLEQKVARFGHTPQVTIIENWADLDIVFPIVTEKQPERIVLEYAGNIGRLQGLHTIIDNIRTANNIELQLHLWGTGAEEKELRNYVAKYEMKNVVFHGPYARSRQIEVINDCDLALVTLAEGMYGLGVPSKAYNIMAAGKALLFIGDANSEIGLLVKEKQIGYVFEPSDSNGIVQFLSEMSTEKRAEYAKMGKRARKVAEEEYAKEKILEKYIEAI